MDKLKKNIKLDYLYKFFSSFSITSAIWVLYLSYKGMDLVQIGVLESIFHGTSLIFEIPTGAIADILGRKKVIVIGRLLSLISCIIIMVSNSFIFFAIGFIIDALSYNLNSGSEEALVYDSLKEMGEEESYTKISGRLNFIIEVASAIAVFVGGALSEISFSLSYLVAIFINIISFAVSTRFIEVDNKEKDTRVSIVNHFKESFGILKEDKSLRKLLLYFPIVSVFSATVFFYSQEYFSQLGYSRLSISIIFLINGVLSGVGSIISDKFISYFNKNGFILIPFCMGVSIILFVSSDGIFKIIFFSAIGLFTAMLYPISSNLINKLIPSEKRATIISVDSMIFSIGMIILFPISGWIGEKLNLGLSFLFVGIIITVASALLIKIKSVALKEAKETQKRDKSQ